MRQLRVSPAEHVLEGIASHSRARRMVQRQERWCSRLHRCLPYYQVLLTCELGRLGLSGGEGHSSGRGGQDGGTSMVTELDVEGAVLEPGEDVQRCTHAGHLTGIQRLSGWLAETVREAYGEIGSTYA